MANTYLLDIGINDSLQDVIRKTNFNLRRLSSDQSRQSDMGIRREGSRVDAVLDGAVGDINNAVTNGLKAIDTRVDELLEEINEAMAPPIDTYIICDYDPNEQWPSTTWEEQDDLDFTDIPVWKRVS